MYFFKEQLQNHNGGCVPAFNPIKLPHARKSGAKCKITNDQVRELRILHEVQRLSEQSIVRKYCPVYDVTEETIINILTYRTRLSPQCEIYYTK